METESSNPSDGSGPNSLAYEILILICSGIKRASRQSGVHCLVFFLNPVSPK